MTNDRRRWPVLVLLVLICAVLGPGMAWSATTALNTTTTTVKSTTWSAVWTATSRGTSADHGPVQAALDGDTFWYITNTGTATLGTAFTVVLPLTATGGATAQVEQCNSGTWDPSTDLCSSGSTSVVATTGGANIYPLPSAYPSGAFILMRLHPTYNGSGNTATLGVLVTKN